MGWSLSDNHAGEKVEDRLNVRAFFVRFTGLNRYTPLPDSLTLHYLDGSRTRPESTSNSFVPLHRVVPGRTKHGQAIFGSRERVLAVDGQRFEVYVAAKRVVKGSFRKLEGENWELECKSALESAIFGVEAAAEFCVAAEGQVALTDRVVMKGVKRRRVGFVALETIPEESEDECGSDGCCCSGEEWEIVSDGGDLEEWCDVDADDVDLETAVEGVSWAVDVGFWVMCLGLGFVVSKSSAHTLRRLRLL